jgi:Kef-type K+ transport system membrane component KefB
VKRHALAVTLVLAAAAGVGVAILSLAADWGVWAIYGALVLAGLLIVSVATPPILGPITRSHGYEGADVERARL